jgi:hypothetical protein
MTLRRVEMAAAQHSPNRQPPLRPHANDAADRRDVVVYMPFEDVEEERLWDQIMAERGFPLQ